MGTRVLIHVLPSLDSLCNWLTLKQSTLYLHKVCPPLHRAANDNPLKQLALTSVLFLTCREPPLGAGVATAQGSQHSKGVMGKK